MQISYFWIHFLFHLSILTNYFPLTVSQSGFLYQFCIASQGNYTNNSPYQTNLNSLFSSLSSEIDEYGFYSSVPDKNPDTPHVIVLCRGDVALDSCRRCINDSIYFLPQICPNYKEVIGWYDYCMLRYSNRSISGMLEMPSAQVMCMRNPTNATNTKLYDQAMKSLFSSLRIKAAAGGDHRKIAAGNLDAYLNSTVFGSMQCTPDLSEYECNNCLVDALRYVDSCSGGKIGGRIYGPSCNFRYENYRFYNDIVIESPPLSVPPPTNNVTSLPPASSGKGNDNSKTIIVVISSACAFLFLFIACCIIIFIKMKQRKARQRVQTAYENGEVESLQHDFEIISAATNNFSDDNKLGEGGFGEVFKGTLSDGQEIAVKRLSRDSGQGEQEFKNEIALLVKLLHRNLVRLLGFCLRGNERLLIYEFVPNLSLDRFIFDHAARLQLDWQKRYKIIYGIARGLLYLHEDSIIRIIHRDLKASNVLLDLEMNPKISDFGMARVCMIEETHGSTSQIVGTYGYMAPEYAMHGQFSIKSDVYSFGVLVLEILSGQNNNTFSNNENSEDLLSFTWKNWCEGTAPDVIDPVLRSNLGSIQEIIRCIHVGLLCVQENVVERPSMASVSLMLNSPSFTLPVPSEPAFFVPEDIENATDESMSGSNGISRNGLSITELHPR